MARIATSTPREGFNPYKFTRNAVIIAGVIALAVWFYVEGVHPNVFPKNFGVVAEGRVYRSGELTPTAMRRVVERHGIRTVVDLGAHDHGTREDERARRVAEALGVERLVFRLYGDGTGDPNQYVRTLDVMSDPERQPVLVHCGAGSERTGCAAAFYRIIIEGEDREAAYAETGEFRHNPERNPHMRPMFDRWADDIVDAYLHGGLIEFDGHGPSGGGIVTDDQVRPRGRPGRLPG